MRRGALVLGTLLVACEPLHDPGAPVADVPRCPRPCPASCAESCLPSGYCRRVVRTQAELDLPPLRAGESAPTLVLEGLPPRAEVRLAAHLGVDAVQRGGQVPASYWFGVLLDGRDEAGEAAVGRDFPVWYDLSGRRETDDAGRVSVGLRMLRCKVGDGAIAEASCTLDPASSFTAELVTTVPWSEAPPCE